MIWFYHDANNRMAACGVDWVQLSVTNTVIQDQSIQKKILDTQYEI